MRVRFERVESVQCRSQLLWDLKNRLVSEKTDLDGPNCNGQ